jgi:hypothetical protein
MLFVILGIILIVYGVVKFVLCSIELFFPMLNVKNDFLSHFVSKDRTFAGKFIYIVLFLFAIFSILKGLSWVGAIRNLNFSFYFYIFMNLFFGIMLVVFYYLVAYTNAPIDKIVEEKQTYVGLGLCGGLTFLLTIPLIMIYYGFFKEKKIKLNLNPITLGLIIMATAAISYIDLKLFIDSGEFYSIKSTIDMIMISLNVF